MRKHSTIRTNLSSKQAKSILLTAVLLISQLILPVNAEDSDWLFEMRKDGILASKLTRTFDFADLGISVSLPDKFDVITRGTPADDPVFAAYGITKDDFILTAEASGMFLNAFQPDIGCELSLTKSMAATADFNVLSESGLSAVKSFFDQWYKNSDLLVFDKSELYTNANMKFIKIYSSREENGTTVYILQYVTCYRGQMICIVMRSFAEEISQKKESLMRRIIDGIDFWNAEAVTQDISQSAPIQYSDVENGLTFTVPSGWKETALSTDREILKVKFRSETEIGAMISYGFSDIWSKMPPEERVGHVRSDFDNDCLTEADIKSFFTDFGPVNVSRAVYADVEYYILETNASTEVGDVSISFPIIVAVRIYDGGFYQFQFSGTRSSICYPDFEALLESVQYPQVESSSSLISGSSENTWSSLHIAVAGILICALVSICAIIGAACFSSKKAKKEQGKARFCGMCGAAVPAESEFCHKCGARLNMGGSPNHEEIL